MGASTAGLQPSSQPFPNYPTNFTPLCKCVSCDPTAGVAFLLSIILKKHLHILVRILHKFKTLQVLIREHNTHIVPQFELTPKRLPRLASPGPNPPAETWLEEKVHCVAKSTEFGLIMLIRE